MVRLRLLRVGLVVSVRMASSIRAHQSSTGSAMTRPGSKAASIFEGHQLPAPPRRPIHGTLLRQPRRFPAHQQSSGSQLSRMVLMCPSWESRFKSTCPCQKDTFTKSTRGVSASCPSRTIEHGSRTVALHASNETRGPSARTSWQGTCCDRNATGGQNDVPAAVAGGAASSHRSGPST